ncbi:hypothetical protein N7G274_010526 [Stereocaulon virgatum]|uniref:RING-type domain-containing protein n=1 Tax=Stereocaulon virgatum TaxID=373712 RepID=A0ABR3ZV28_9LECA
MEQLLRRSRDIIATLEFLLRVPYIELEELEPQNKTCFICLEPYQQNVWKEGETINGPVRLGCGHHLDIQCLARYMLSTRWLDKRCPLCETAILSRRSRVQFVRFPSRTTIAILKGVPDAILENGSVMPSIKEHVLVLVRQISLDEQIALGVEPDLDRPMILMEEYFQKMQRDHEAQERQRQQDMDRERLLELVHQLDRQIPQRLATPIQEPLPEPTFLRAAIAVILILAIAHWYPLGYEGSLSGTRFFLDTAVRLIDVIHLVSGVIIIAFDPPRAVLGRLARLLLAWVMFRLWVVCVDFTFQASLRLGEHMMKRYSRQDGQSRL